MGSSKTTRLSGGVRRKSKTPVKKSKSHKMSKKRMSGGAKKTYKKTSKKSSKKSSKKTKRVRKLKGGNPFTPDQQKKVDTFKALVATSDSLSKLFCKLISPNGKEVFSFEKLDHDLITKATSYLINNKDDPSKKEFRTQAFGCIPKDSFGYKDKLGAFLGLNANPLYEAMSATCKTSEYNRLDPNRHTYEVCSLDQVTKK